MKVCVKVQDQQPPHQNPVLLRAKIPITVLGLPFLSGFSATHSSSHNSSDLSLSLRTHFPSGPSLKLSYTPTTPTSTTPPLTLTLKSGISLFGSPNNSPLIISAHFSFSNPNPTFSLQFKPYLGDFSLHKTTTSSNPNPNPNPKPSNDSFTSIGFVPLERSMSMPVTWKDLTMESATKDSVLSGIAVMAKTALPVTKRVAVNLRWGVNFPADFGKQLPFLSVNKIGIERVEEVKEGDGLKENEKVGDLQMVKGMYSWMRRELDVLQKENREMKHTLEEMKLGKKSYGYSNGNGNGNGGAKESSPVVENSVGFEEWRKKKKSSGGEENGGKGSKKNNAVPTSDVESELQRAIKAASS